MLSGNTMLVNITPCLAPYCFRVRAAQSSARTCSFDCFLIVSSCMWLVLQLQRCFHTKPSGFFPFVVIVSHLAYLPSFRSHVSPCVPPAHQFRTALSRHRRHPP